MQQIIGCDQAVSNNAVAVISPDLLVTTQPTDVNECIGGTNTMTVVSVVVQVQSAINGSQAQMDQQDGRMQQAQVQLPQSYTSKYSSRNNLLQVSSNMLQITDAIRRK
jgi:hypothetical protein